MQTLPPSGAPAPGSGQEAARDLQRLLLDLGAEPELLARIRDDWTTQAGDPHVYIPPLPAQLVQQLAQLVPPWATA